MILTKDNSGRVYAVSEDTVVERATLEARVQQAQNELDKASADLSMYDSIVTPVEAIAEAPVPVEAAPEPVEVAEPATVAPEPAVAPEVVPAEVPNITIQ